MQAKSTPSLLILINIYYHAYTNPFPHEQSTHLLCASVLNYSALFYLTMSHWQCFKCGDGKTQAHNKLASISSSFQERYRSIETTMMMTHLMHYYAQSLTNEGTNVHDVCGLDKWVGKHKTCKIDHALLHQSCYSVSHRSARNL